MKYESHNDRMIRYLANLLIVFGLAMLVLVISNMESRVTKEESLVSAFLDKTYRINGLKDDVTASYSSIAGLLGRERSLIC